MAAKGVFEVGDVLLPATTQLKVSWIKVLIQVVVLLLLQIKKYIYTFFIDYR